MASHQYFPVENYKSRLFLVKNQRKVNISRGGFPVESF